MKTEREMFERCVPQKFLSWIVFDEESNYYKFKIKDVSELKRQENKKHQLKICNETLDSLKSFGLDEAIAKALINAMHEKKIANVSINY